MANITVSPRGTHPATYVQLTGVSMAGMGPLAYALHDGLVSIPGWASVRYFAETVWSMITADPIANLVYVALLIAVGGMLARPFLHWARR